MKSKSTKTFTIQGKTMRFNREAFNQAILHRSRQKHMRIGDLEQMLADEIAVSVETIRNWRKGSNGPGSETYIETAAACLGVHDWTSLFTETEGETDMAQLTDNQMNAVKKIYDACVEVLNHFLYLENVRAMLREYRVKHEADPDYGAEEATVEISHRMYLVIDQEYFYLKGTDIYNELAEHTVDIANEVVTTLHDYTDEDCDPEEDFDELSQDANRSMRRLNEIIDRYC